MTIAELIERLKMLPADAPALANCFGHVEYVGTVFMGSHNGQRGVFIGGSPTSGTAIFDEVKCVAARHGLVEPVFSEPFRPGERPRFDGRATELLAYRRAGGNQER